MIAFPGLVRSRIRIAVLQAEINVMQFNRGIISAKELNRREQKIVQTLYTYIAGLEPSHESEVV